MNEFSRDSFVFYRSFFEAIEEADDVAQLQLYRAIALYALNHEEPQLSGLTKALWIAIRPQIDANFKRYINGRKGGKDGIKGGAPKGNQNAKKQPQNNPKTTPNVNVNENENENVELKMITIDSNNDKKQLQKTTGRQRLQPLPLTANGNIDFARWRKQVYEFGEAQGISQDQCQAFFEYTQMNTVCDTTNPLKDELLDKNGKRIKNWGGAFIRFCESGYTREKWEREHGIKNGYLEY